MGQLAICFVTGNKSKFHEAELLLRDLDIKLVQKPMKLAEIKTLDQEKLVISKAEQAYMKLRKPVIVDDTAIYFSEYNNFPGTHTKDMFSALGFKGIQRLFNGSDRRAYFKTLVCYKDKDTTKLFSGIFWGKIVKDISRKFNPDWQYNSIFVPDGFHVPLSELPLKERAKKSHRKLAFDGLRRFLNERAGV